MPKTYKIAILPGDGIGREVIPQAVEVLSSACNRVGGIDLELVEYECGGEFYLKEGREWSVECETFVKKEADATLLGAIGALGPNGDNVRLADGNLAGYNVIIGLRMELDLYANVRPVKLYEGVPTPLAGKTHNDIDMVIVRENTEGLYAPTHGILSRGGVEDVAIDTRIITKKGAERVARFAFNIAMERNGAPKDGKKRVTCVDKSNLLAGCQLFRRSFTTVSSEFPKVQTDYAYVDAWTQWCVRKPEFYDVVVAPNEFGDIITDLGGAIQGGLGVAPAGNIGENKGVFEPVHGSAPKHYGENRANPIASILAAAMMLDWIETEHGDSKAKEASDLIKQAVERVLKEGKVRTYDLCIGDWSSVTPSSTTQVAEAIISSMSKIE